MTPEIWNELRASIKSVVVEAVREAMSGITLDRQSPPKPTVDQEPFLISQREAAKRMGISSRTLWQLTATGEIPSVKLGRLVRYSPRTIQNWVEQHEVRRRKRPVDQPQQSKASGVAKGRGRSPNGKTAEREVDQPRYITEYCAERLGVSPGDLPVLTNGQIAKIAQVDVRVLHSWKYHRRDMPEEALARVQEYFSGCLQAGRDDSRRAGPDQ